jgi:hypothetical protein
MLLRMKRFILKCMRIFLVDGCVNEIRFYFVHKMVRVRRLDYDPTRYGRQTTMPVVRQLLLILKSMQNTTPLHTSLPHLQV